jgi:hypothetical protein
MAKYQNKESGVIVEANRVSDPDLTEREIGVEVGDWKLSSGAYVKPDAFAEQFEWVSA